MKDKQDIIIVGTGGISKVASEYFLYDSIYNPVAYSVNGDYIKEKSFRGLPVVPFEEVEEIYPPDGYAMFIAIGYKNLNHLRADFFQRASKKDYKLVSYISSKAFVWRNVEIGDNCFILEGNTIQPFVKIGNNVTLWSGNHIGHESVIRDHVNISSHVVISGYCDIGEYSFIGVNATLGDEVKVGRNSLIGAGAILTRSVPEDRVYLNSSSLITKNFSDLSKYAREMYEPSLED